MKICIPGVNKILGTFSSCSCGPALCTLDKKELFAEFEIRDDNTVKACLVKTGECKKFALSNAKVKKEDKWFNAIKGVYLHMMKKYPDIKCFDVTLDGDLLDCEGFVVSTAVALATVKALDKTMKLGLTNEDIVSCVSNSLNSVGMVGSLGNIITMLYGSYGSFVLYNGVSNKYSILDNPFKGSEYQMIIVDGHVPVASLREEALFYAEATENAIKKYCRAHGCRYVNFGDSGFKENLSELQLDEDEKRLFKYLCEENRAAFNVEEVIKNKDIAGLGKIFDKVRQTYNENLDMVCPENEWLVKRAYENPGCLGACLFFEGYSTKAVAIVKKEYMSEYEKHIEDYQHIFGFDVTTDVFGENV